MPDSIATAITAPAAAPSTPAPAAPPAAPPVAAPPASSAPTTTVAPAAPVSDGTAVPSGPQPPTRPDSSQMDMSEWYQANAKYQQDLLDFKREHPEVEIPEIKPEEAKPSETTTEPEIKTEETTTEEVKPEDTDQFSLEDEPSLTPQALNDLIKGKPEREAFLNSDPELKNALFKMSREHAELSQFKGIYPSAESAKFAKDTADRTVSLRAKFTQADTPEAMTSAFDDFAQEFAVVGADGKQIMEDGQPVYADDFYGMLEHIVRDRFLTGDLEEIQARLDANQYITPEDRTRDEDDLIATQIKLAKFSGDKPKDPDLSGVPENLRADMQRRLDDVKAREAALEAKSGKAAKEAAATARKEATTQYFNEVGQRTFDQVNQTIDKMRKAGVSVPDWMLQTKIPGTNTPVFYAEIGKEVDALLSGDPWTRKTMMELEAKAATPENLQARVQFYDSVLARTNERGISNIKAIVSKIVRGFGKGLQEQAAAKPEPTTTASREPRGGGPVTPKTMTRDDAYRQATKELSKEVPGWNDLQPNEQMALAMTRQMQLMQVKR